MIHRDRMPPADSTKLNDQPIRAFGRFFRSYGLGVSLVISSLPLAARQWDLLPQFAGMKPLLTAMASGSSFLLVGIIFAQRHLAARRFFPGRQIGGRRFAHSDELRIARRFAWVPTLLGFAALASLIGYFTLIAAAEREVAYQYAVSLDTQGPPKVRCAQMEGNTSVQMEGRLEQFGNRQIQVICSKDNEATPAHRVQFLDEATVVAIREGTPSTSIPYQIWMGLTFLLTFCCAAAAFVLTGLKDYLQAQIGMSDRDLILHDTATSRRQRFDVERVPGVYGIVEFSPNAPELDPILSGPFCAWHDRQPEPAGIDSAGKVTKWQHVFEKDNETVTIPCELAAPVTVGEFDRLFFQSGARIVEVGSTPAAVDTLVTGVEGGTAARTG